MAEKNDGTEAPEEKTVLHPRTVREDMTVLYPGTRKRMAREATAKRVKAAGALPAMLWRRARQLVSRPLVRRSLIGAGAVLVVFVLVFAGLWWRLASGPIAFDVATPWLTAAIEDNFGENYKVQVGGSQIE